MAAQDAIGRKGRLRGCMLGLAIGDALGAPAEHLCWGEIRERFGKAGVTDLEAWRDLPAGSITDDTQMSLATATGLIEAMREISDGSPFNSIPAVWCSYLAWHDMQCSPENRRDPGLTCLTALAGGQMGTIEHPANDSKGCGGVMRVAPAGLAFAPEEAFRQATTFAAMTHGHPSGYLSAGVLAAVIASLSEGLGLEESVAIAREILVGWQGKGAGETIAAVDAAVALAAEGTAVAKAIGEIGEGWVGEEALAIAIFCALRFPTDFRTAVLAAVNHSGDSDSTGSIAGAIMGTCLGEEGIPAEWVCQLERRDEIMAIADELHRLFARE